MENYKNESLVDVAYAVLKDKKESISFAELFSKVCDLAEISTDKASDVVASFFTNLSLDGRFVTIKNNEWGLRKNYKFDDYHKESYDLYDEDASETIVSGDEEDEEDKILRGEDVDEDENDESSDTNEENEEY